MLKLLDETLRAITTPPGQLYIRICHTTGDPRDRASPHHQAGSVLNSRTCVPSRNAGAVQARNYFQGFFKVASLSGGFQSLGLGLE